MKICIVLPPLLPVPAVKGGAVETLVEQIITLNEKYKKLDIDCITINDKEAKKSFHDFQYTTFYTINTIKNPLMNNFLRVLNWISRKLFQYNFMQLMYEKKYNNFLLKNNYDLIIFEGENFYINKRILEHFGKEKLVFHVHHVMHYIGKYEKYFENYICISDYAEKVLTGSGLIAKERVHKLYNGIDLNQFSKKAGLNEIHELKIKHGIGQRDIVILYVGRLIKGKGLEELITAFKNMKNKNCCKLLIVGSANSGSNKQTHYVKELKKLAKDENIIFTGYVDNNLIYKYYNIANFAVFPSTIEEGLGMVVIESLLCECPVIITNSGGMPEIVNEKCAITIDLNEKLIDNLSEQMDKLSMNSELCSQMASEAKNAAKKFSSEKYYNGYVDILKKIKEK